MGPASTGARESPHPGDHWERYSVPRFESHTRTRSGSWVFSGSRSRHCCPITLTVEGIKVDAASSEGQAFLFCSPRLPSPAQPPVRAGGQRGCACCLRGGTGLVEAEIISPLRLWICFQTLSPGFECTTGILVPRERTELLLGEVLEQRVWARRGEPGHALSRFSWTRGWTALLLPALGGSGGRGERV